VVVRHAQTGPGEVPRKDLREAGLDAVSVRDVVPIGTAVPLTEREFELLWVVASHADVTLGRRELPDPAVGADSGAGRRSIDTRVRPPRPGLHRDRQPAERARAVRRSDDLFCAQDG